jgi:hypothetical protein
MKALCIKQTTKLVKGSTYKVASYQNQNLKTSPYFRSTIRIFLNDNSIHTFPIDCFMMEDGTDFPQLNWICPDYQLFLNEREQTKIDKNLKSGDYVIPLYDSLKTLIRGRMYRVKEVKFKEHKSTMGHTTWTDIKIKLDGSERLYTSWNFRKCTNQESREIGLRQIFDEQTNTETVNKHKRKFDYYDEDDKKKLLIQFLVNASNDRFRNQLDIIDWAVTKTSKGYKLERKDFDSIMSLTVEDILRILR